MRNNKKVKLPVGISDFKDIIENNFVILVNLKWTCLRSKFFKFLLFKLF